MWVLDPESPHVAELVFTKRKNLRRANRRATQGYLVE